MTRENKSERIIAYLLGDLTSEDKIMVENMVGDDPRLQEQVKQYQQLLDEWQSTKIQSLPESRIKHFENWLENEIQISSEKGKLRTLNWWKYIAVASIFLLLGIGGINYLNQVQTNKTFSQKKTDLLRLVSADNTTGRIKILNQFQTESINDPDILNAFIHVLENDKSTNVRLAAVDALSNLPHDEAVKSVLIRILKDDQEPAIQMAIINVLVKWRDPSSKSTLEELLKEDELPEDVKEEAFLGVTRL
ncbi:MAG: HEAT repeat domain-containing protein [Saprospiraceae bacterium]|nr:HEAT repeat domain-containing protein [Saprospiraceae bacterium]